MKTCNTCGRSLEDVFAIYVWKPVGGTPQQFCSAKCKDEARRARSRMITTMEALNAEVQI